MRVRLTVEPAELADADLVVLPGSKSTVDDLAWLRRDRPGRRGAARTPRPGKPLLGICGGFQMLGRAHPRRGGEPPGRRSPGSGLLPVEITFAPAQDAGPAARARRSGAPVRGYEIHHGYVVARAIRR